MKNKRKILVATAMGLALIVTGGLLMAKEFKGKPQKKANSEVLKAPEVRVKADWGAPTPEVNAEVRKIGPEPVEETTQSKSSAEGEIPQEKSEEEQPEELKKPVTPADRPPSTLILPQNE